MKVNLIALTVNRRQLIGILENMTNGVNLEHLTNSELVQMFEKLTEVKYLP